MEANAAPMLTPANQIVGQIFSEKIAPYIYTSRPHVLEIGCGYGIAATHIRQISNKLTLTDIDKTAVKFISNKWKTDKDISVIQGTIQEVEGQFDVIYYFLSLHHIPDIKVELMRARSLLLPDGQLFLCELIPIPDQPFHRQDYSAHEGFFPDELSEILNSCNYIVTGIEHITTIAHCQSTYNIYMIIAQKQTKPTSIL